MDSLATPQPTLSGQKGSVAKFADFQGFPGELKIATHSPALPTNGSFLSL